MAKPFFRKATFRLYMGQDDLGIPATAHNIERNATEIAEGVLGEPRDRLDSVTNYYSFSLTAKLEDLGLILKFIEDQQNKDANAFPLVKTGIYTAYPRDGSKQVLRFTGVEIGNWKMAMSGRASGEEVTVPCRAQDMTKKAA